MKGIKQSDFLLRIFLNVLLLFTQHWPQATFLIKRPKKVNVSYLTKPTSSFSIYTCTNQRNQSLFGTCHVLNIAIFTALNFKSVIAEVSLPCIVNCFRLSLKRQFELRPLSITGRFILKTMEAAQNCSWLNSLFFQPFNTFENIPDRRIPVHADNEDFVTAATANVGCV